MIHMNAEIERIEMERWAGQAKRKIPPS